MKGLKRYDNITNFWTQKALKKKNRNFTRDGSIEKENVEMSPTWVNNSQGKNLLNSCN